MQNSSIGAGISVRLTFCCPCSRGIWMFWTESSHCFHARGKMSYVPFPIRKHRFTVCQNVHKSVNPDMNIGSFTFPANDEESDNVLNSGIDFQDHHYPSEMSVDAMVQTFLLDTSDNAQEKLLKKFDSDWKRYNRDLIRKVQDYQKEKEEQL